MRERPCPHPGCNKVFMIDRYLQRHVKLIHTGEVNRKFCLALDSAVLTTCDLYHKTSSDESGSPWDTWFHSALILAILESCCHKHVDMQL